MNFGPNCAFDEVTMARTLARAMVGHIKSNARWVGVRQVRLYRGFLRTYPYPAPRGYGTRGVLVGIYTRTARRAWIEEDLLKILLGEKS